MKNIKLILFFLVFIPLSFTGFTQEEQPLEETKPSPGATPRLPIPRETELILAQKENKQTGVQNYYYKYRSGLEREEILDFYRHMFSKDKGYREERRGLPDDDTKRNQFFFMKGAEEFVFLGFFYETEEKDRLTYFLNITKMDISQIPKEPGN